MKKFCFAGVLTKGKGEKHKHLTIFETFIEAKSLEEAKKIAKEDFKLEIYQTYSDHEKTLKSPEKLDKETTLTACQ